MSLSKQEAMTYMGASAFVGLVAAYVISSVQKQGFVDKQKIRDRGSEKKVGQALTLQRKKTNIGGRIESSSSLAVDEFGKGRADDDFFNEDDANLLVKQMKK